MRFGLVLAWLERWSKGNVAEVLTHVQSHYAQAKSEVKDAKTLADLGNAGGLISELVSLKNNPGEDLRTGTHRFDIRKNILLLRNEVKQLTSHSGETMPDSLQNLVDSVNGLRKISDYAPFWVILLIALSLACGTMIGWERIVVTYYRRASLVRCSLLAGFRISTKARFKRYFWHGYSCFPSASRCRAHCS